MSVFIKAQNVQDCGNGVFRVDLPEREMTQEERELVLKLFPNLTDRAYDLMSQEALIGSLASQSDVEKAQRSEANFDARPVTKAEVKKTIKAPSY